MMSAKSSTPLTEPARRKKGLRGLLTILVILVIVIAVAGYFLLGYSPIPKTSTYQLDIAQIRQLAGTDSSLFPTRLNTLVLGQGSMPEFIVIAGGGLQGVRTPVPVFQIVSPTGTVIVDTGMDEASFDPDVWRVPFSTVAYDQTPIRHAPEPDHSAHA